MDGIRFLRGSVYALARPFLYDNSVRDGAILLRKASLVECVREFRARSPIDGNVYVTIYVGTAPGMPWKD